MKNTIAGIAFLALLVGASMPAQGGFMSYFGIDNSPGAQYPQAVSRTQLATTFLATYRAVSERKILKASQMAHPHPST